MTVYDWCLFAASLTLWSVCLVGFMFGEAT